jgi:hypothetical protein
VASLSLNEARWWTSRARPTDRSITSHPDPSSTSTSLMEWPTPHCIIKQSWSQYTAMMQRLLLDMERGTENCRRLQKNAARRGNSVEWSGDRAEQSTHWKGGGITCAGRKGHGIGRLHGVLVVHLTPDFLSLHTGHFVED